MAGKSLRNVCFATLAVAFVAALLSACGGGSGGDGTGSDGTASISDAAFVKQANAICEKGKKVGLKKLQRYMQAHEDSGKSTATRLAEALQSAFLPQIQKQVDEIRALDIPRKDEKQVEAVLTALEEAVAAKRDKPASAASGPQLSRRFKQASKLAREAGLTACVYSGS